MKDRVIKFRGKQNTWEYGGYAYTFGEHSIINDSGSFEVDGSTVGQCIGLNDISGEPIFEGDINTDHGICIWGDFCFCWQYPDGDIHDFDGSEPEWCLIIGNVTDNHDLLP